MTVFFTAANKFLGLVPAWVWAAIVASLLALLLVMDVKISNTESSLQAEKAAHLSTKFEQASADNRSLLNLSERYITLSDELSVVKQKGADNATALQVARSELANVFSSMRNNAKLASELERDFIAAGYKRASIYAAGVENVYRSCAKEYIDLGVGVGGAAEAANAAYAQKGRADAIVRALPPIRPVPQTK